MTTQVRSEREGDIALVVIDNPPINAGSDLKEFGKPLQGPQLPAVIAALNLPMDEALARELAVFQELRVSREAKALRHLFFAESESAKHPRLAGVAPRSIDFIAILGAGTMGAGIAIAALDAKYRVLLLERDEPALERGCQQIRDHYAARVEAGKLDPAAASERQARLESSIDWGRLAGVDMVIEAVFEDLAVKQDVFRRLDGVMRPGAVLASNTSYLDLDAIAGASSRPWDVVGLHFFSPAHVMRLLEVVRGAATAPDVLATGIEVGKRLRKLPIITGNAFGFIGNRIYAAYRRQCEFLLEEGANPEQVDAALESFGFAMGPFAVADMSGLDIAWRMRKSQAATRDPKARYVHIPDRLCEAGRLGRKTQAGYYRYEPGSKGRKVDPAVHAIVDQARVGAGIVPRSLSDDEIQRRTLLAMVNEAALLLGEGIAERASDVDLVLTNGYGFPRREGGPVFWARERGREALEKDLDWLVEVSGPVLVRGDVRHLWDQEN